ncbi:hypothetical protein J2T17_004353 [Paenibacillus mucilaginosus]|uniref:hypothetical protein n=1 Tax=Paenibacillus mucilaginosus TaxID=61624 RepID=UPI003D2498E4
MKENKETIKEEIMDVFQELFAALESAETEVDQNKIIVALNRLTNTLVEVDMLPADMKNQFQTILTRPNEGE